MDERNEDTENQGDQDNQGDGGQQEATPPPAPSPPPPSTPFSPPPSQGAGEQKPQTIIIKSTKSVGIAILLTFLFGPLGMFYSTIWGAIIMIVISAIIGIFTLGIGLFVTWPICIIWCAVAANNYNKKLGA